MSEEQQGPEQFAQDTERKLRERIEQLERENARLDAGWTDANFRALDAGLKLAKAVEALRDIRDDGDDIYPWRKAREVLAELEVGE